MANIFWRVVRAPKIDGEIGVGEINSQRIREYELDLCTCIVCTAYTQQKIGNLSNVSKLLRCQLTRLNFIPHDSWI